MEDLPCIVLPLLLFVALIMLRIFFWIRSHRNNVAGRRYEQHRCMRCGYDIRFNIDRCPECGDDLVEQAKRFWKGRVG